MQTPGDTMMSLMLQQFTVIYSRADSELMNVMFEPVSHID